MIKWAHTLQSGSFNTQPPEGGCSRTTNRLINIDVSTHSRPKAAAQFNKLIDRGLEVSTHSRPKAAAFVIPAYPFPFKSFNTQPPEGGCASQWLLTRLARCFNTQPPEGGCTPNMRRCRMTTCFNTQPPEGGCGRQHYETAARVGFNTQPPEGGCPPFYRRGKLCKCFNTQPPEGGCQKVQTQKKLLQKFQHTAARRRLPRFLPPCVNPLWFQHTAARRRLRG